MNAPAAPPTIPLSEFARRLCVTEHAAYGTTGAIVPCGQHISDAQRLWGLLTAGGSKTLDVILQIRREEQGDHALRRPPLQTPDLAADDGVPFPEDVQRAFQVRVRPWLDELDRVRA